MNGAVTLAGRARWLGDPDLQRLLAALNRNGEEARIVGGAVRNTLLGLSAGDVDIATTTLPQETMARAEAAGFRTVPSGIEHGTVMAVANGVGHEITTLREDVETHGRRATVRFGRDWAADAARRDFTMNALYARSDGTVIDLVGGVADLEQRRLRFIGDPATRIREDYLRILRFFRFFAWYGAGRPDADGLKACARLKDGLSALSAERVWAELRKLLGAPDPSRALLWMRQAGVLTAVLPESDKWGIDAIHALSASGRALDWPDDPMLRLMAIVPPDPARMENLARRLRISNAERDRLVEWALSPPPSPGMTDAALDVLLWKSGSQPVLDGLRLAHAAARSHAETDAQSLRDSASYARLVERAQGWTRPVMPVRGGDIVAAGMPPGPEISARLKRMEDAWVASGFRLAREELLAIS